LANPFVAPDRAHLPGESPASAVRTATTAKKKENAMQMRMYLPVAVAVILLIGQGSVFGQVPVGSEFTYQGQLREGGIPADGDYDFVFRLYDADTGGAQVGGDVEINERPVSDGLFTVELDFGTEVFTGDARWIEVGVREGGGGGSEYTTLSPRQPVNAAPYALYALDGPGGAGGYWAANGDDIYNTNSGNVGIGIMAPEHPLDVAGDLRGRECVAFGNDAAFGTGGTWYPDWPRVFDFSHMISTDFSLAPAWAPVRSLITVDPTGGGDEEIYSHDFEVFVPPSNAEDIYILQGPALMATHLGGGTVSRFVGAFALCENNGGGTADYQTGFGAQSIVRSGVGVIGENRGIEIWTGHWGSAGSIATNIGLWIATPWNRQPLTNHYGIYLQDQDVGVNDSYAIYVAGGDSYFNGDLEVTGTVSKSGGSFKIDHPLDPENKYLYHSFVESPDMMNIYNGNIVTDDDGRAWVQLPDYFEALNQDFRYQLTVVGQFAQAIVEQEVENGGFQIRTDKPGVKVSWQVTGIRKDPWAERNRIPVEEDKLPDDQGKYLHPELYGQPAELGVHYRQPRPPIAYEGGRASQHVAQ
jgi:hypothetical protein